MGKFKNMFDWISQLDVEKKEKTIGTMLLTEIAADYFEILQRWKSE